MNPCEAWTRSWTLKMSREFMERRSLPLSSTQDKSVLPASVITKEAFPYKEFAVGRKPGFGSAHQAETPRSGGHAIKPIRSISFMRIKMAGDKTKRRLQKLRSDASPAHSYSQRFSWFASGEANGRGACTIASSPTFCVAQIASSQTSCVA